MQSVDTFLMRAMCTAIKIAVRFYAMPNDFTPAMLALRRQGMNRTLETIEEMRFTSAHNLERLVIFISTNFAMIHILFSVLNSGIRFPTSVMQEAGLRPLTG
jgi:hypothetical protein